MQLGCKLNSKGSVDPSVQPEQHRCNLPVGDCNESSTGQMQTRNLSKARNHRGPPGLFENVNSLIVSSNIVMQSLQNPLVVPAEKQLADQTSAPLTHLNTLKIIPIIIRTTNLPSNQDPNRRQTHRNQKPTLKPRLNKLAL